MSRVAEGARLREKTRVFSTARARPFRVADRVTWDFRASHTGAAAGARTEIIPAIAELPSAG